jgi:hypothetical protein
VGALAVRTEYREDLDRSVDGGEPVWRVVVNSTAWPGSTVRSSSPRISRIRPLRTYIQS